MQILLLQPRSPGPAMPGQSVEPLALESLAAMVPDHDLCLVDLRFERRSLSQVLREVAPTVVAMGPLTVQYHNTRQLLREVEAHDPGIVTVVGGHHATALPYDFNVPEVDVIVLGMGEQSFRDLIETLAAGGDLGTVPGLALRRDGDLVATAPREAPREIESLPVPRRDLSAAYHHRYRSPWGGSMALLSSARGCPYRCRFCAIWSFTKGRYLTRSASQVVDELSAIPQEAVRWADGNTFGNPRRMEEIAGLVEERGIRKRYMMDLRTDMVVRQRALMERWAALGLGYAAVGLEAVEDARLERLNKGGTVAQHEEAIRILHDHGVQIVGQFMVDPEATPDDFARLVEFVLRHDIEWPIFFIATPLPGTPLFADQRQAIVARSYDYFDLIHPVVPTALPRETFWQEFLRSYRQIYRLGRLRRVVPLHRALALRGLLATVSFMGRREHELPRHGEPDTELFRLREEPRRLAPGGT